MVLLIGLIIIIEVGLAFLFTQKLDLSEYLIPITVAAMVLTIMFDARIGFMGFTSIIMLVGILIGNNVEFIIVMIDGIFVLCAARTEILKIPIWIIRIQDMVVTHKGTAVINDNVFTRFGSIHTAVIGFVFFMIDQFIVGRIGTHFMAPDFFR